MLWGHVYSCYDLAYSTKDIRGYDQRFVRSKFPSQIVSQLAHILSQLKYVGMDGIATWLEDQVLSLNTYKRVELWGHKYFWNEPIGFWCDSTYPGSRGSVSVLSIDVDWKTPISGMYIFAYFFKCEICSI